jgi:hypothetical protein
MRGFTEDQLPFLHELARELPRPYTAAACCSQSGRPATGLEYARRAAVLARDPKYDPLDPWWVEDTQALATST